MDPRDLSDMWRGLLGQGWSSMAVVPAGTGISGRPVAEALAAAARDLDHARVEVIDAEGVSIADGRRLSQALEMGAHGGEKVVVVVDALVGSLAGIPLVMAAESVLLVVGLGETDLDALRSTRDMVGPGRVVGCVAVSSR